MLVYSFGTLIAKMNIMNRHEGPSLPSMEHGTEFRRGLAFCVRLAHAYDGTEATYQALLEGIRAFEQWEFATFKHEFPDHHPTRLSEDAEVTLLKRHHPKIAARLRTVSGLLHLAVEHCSNRLKRGDETLIKTRAQSLDGTILPLGTGGIRPSQGGESFTRETVFSPRVRLLLSALQEKGIYLDDVLLWVGDPPEHALKRTQPYLLIEIPRLNRRQVLICDQVGEAAFVVFEPLDIRILLAESKETLQRDYGDAIRRVTWQSEEAWKTELTSLLFLDSVPGAKADLVVREGVRQKLITGYPPERFFTSDGTFYVSLLDAISIQGRKIKSLLHLFGAPTDSSPTKLECLRFLATVYGRQVPLIDRALCEEEENTALQEELGQDLMKWSKYIKGEPITVRFLGKTRKVICADPIKDSLAFAQTPYHKRSGQLFAGLGASALASLFVKEGKGNPDPLFFRTELAQLLLVEQLMGMSKEITARIRELRIEQALQKTLANDPVKWRKFLLGEVIDIEVQHEHLQTCNPRPLPPMEGFIEQDYRAFQGVSYAGAIFTSIMRRVFAPLEPEIPAAGITVTHSRYNFYLLARALYGSNKLIEQKIQEEKETRAVEAALGRDKDRWRAFIGGEPLMIIINGQSKTITASTPIRSAAEMLAYPVKKLLKIRFGGVGIMAIANIFLSTDGSGVDIVHVADVKRLAVTIFGKGSGDEEDPLEQDLLKTEQHRAVVKLLGHSRSAWRDFVQGKPVTVIVRKQTYTVSVEHSFPNKASIADLPRSERHKLRFAGLGLSALGTKLSIPSTSYRAFYGESLRAILDALFEE